MLVSTGIGKDKSFEIDSPLKAAIFYFPSPSVMRCLNHSEIPKEFRKAIIYRKAIIPNEGEVVQNITIGVGFQKGKGKKFLLKGSITKNNGEIVLMKTKGGPFFNEEMGGQKMPSFFGLEDLLGVQRKVQVRDTIGNQKLDYEVFLKTTKGMVGNANYNLELFGQDRSIKEEIKYFLDGKGKIGEDKIVISGRSLEKDYYEMNEKYGQVEVFTGVKVYD